MQDKKRWLWVKRATLFPAILCIVLLPIYKPVLPAVLGDSGDTWLRGRTWFISAIVALTVFINQIGEPNPTQRWIRARRGAAETHRGR